jgi:GT2 family glycosyltransferase
MAALIWGVAIPFREDPNPKINRRELLQAVLDYLAEVLPEVSPILIDSNPNLPFNRAGARNACVRHAEAEGWDVVVILDADTLPPKQALLEAVAAAGDGGIHQPFRYCVTLNPELSVTPMNVTDQHFDSKTAERIWISPGSCYIVKPAVYWEVGGQDEGFVNWGGEDAAFMLAARALSVPVTRHPTSPTTKANALNTAIQLHHGDAADRRHHPTYKATQLRQSIYHQHSRRSRKMRQWLEERHLPGAEQRWATRQAIARWSPDS